MRLGPQFETSSKIAPVLRGFFFCLLLTAILAVLPTALAAQKEHQVTDSYGREVIIPGDVDRVICSGPGCLRLLTYLQAQDAIVGVDSIEKRDARIDPRPYALANPQFQEYPLFGEHRGRDSPELVAGLDPQPQVIFKTYPDSGTDPDKLQEKTGIPVITLNYGNLTFAREELDSSLRLMGSIMGKKERAEQVVSYFDELQQDLHKRTKDIQEQDRPTCYIGGIAYRGPHGFQSTEPSYSPFEMINARNVAGELTSERERMDHATISRENIIMWDPEVIFLDLSTLRLEQEANALDQLRTDPAYANLSAANADQIYGVFPHNFYTQNFESVLANAYFIGTVLYPDRFQDIDPMDKAEEISKFLNGARAFEEMNQQFGGQGFSRIQAD